MLCLAAVGCVWLLVSGPVNGALVEAMAQPWMRVMVMFPFQIGSPLINKWKISELLPKRFNSKALKHKWMAVKQNLLRSQANMPLRYNRNCVPQPFKVGDLVYYRNHPISHAGRQITAKLLPRWKGPFRVDSFLTPVTVTGGSSYGKFCD